MKKYIFILFAVLVSAFVFTSCSKDDDGSTNPIVGTWTVINESSKETFIFNKNGTASYYYDGIYASPQHEDLKYSYNDGLLKLFWNDGDIFTCSVSFSGNKMIWTEDDGDTCTFTKS